MPTNTQIQSAFASQLYAFASGESLTVAWQGDKTPTDGEELFLEMMFMPNDYDPFLGDARDIKRGMFQVNVVGRKKKTSSAELQAVADLIVAEWPKLTPITGTVQVTRTPYIMGMIESDSRNTLPVTIEYHE